jgi:hypothetical protein
MIAQLLLPGSLANPVPSLAGMEPQVSSGVSMCSTGAAHVALPGPALPEQDLDQVQVGQELAVGIAVPQVAVSVSVVGTEEAPANPEIQQPLPQTAPVLAHAVTGPARRTHLPIPSPARQDLPGEVTEAVEEVPRVTAHASLPVETNAEVVAVPTDKEPVRSDPQLAPPLPFMVPGAWQPPVPVAASSSLHPAAPTIPAVSESRRLAPLAGSDSAVGAASLPVPQPVELPAGAVSAQPPAAPVGASPASQSVPQLPNPVERIVAHQVVRAVARHSGGGDRSLVIRLTPPELGTVRVEIQERDGQLTARLHADDPAVRQALDRLLPQMRSDLRLSDAPLQQITVSSGTATDQGFDGRGFDGRGAQDHPDAGRQSGRQRRGDRPVFSLEADAVAVTAPTSLPGRTRTASGLVDAMA